MQTPYDTRLPPHLARPQAGDRGVRARLRAGLLRDDLRGHRRRRPQRDRRLRRVPHALPALVVRHGLRGAAQGLRLRPLEDLRDGHQQRPVLRLPDAVESHGRSEARDESRLRPLRFLQEQRLLRPHQPQDDGRDRQPRRAHPLLRRELRRGRGRGVRGPLHVDRRPHRHPLRRHPPPRPVHPLRLQARRPGARRPGFHALQVQGLHGRVHQPPRRPPRRGGRPPQAGRADRPQLPRTPREGRPALPRRTRPPQELAARRPLDHPGRGLLLSRRRA